LTVPSPSNPFQDVNGDVQVRPGDRLPSIPEHRLKLGVDYRPSPDWSVGATANFVSDFYYAGDPSNRLAPIPGYAIVNLHASFRPSARLQWYATIDNVLNRRYATFGTLGDPSGVGAPGVPPNAAPGAAVDNRFQSPGAPFEAFAGLRVYF
ncbi:MAG: TonB-dependent receptor, partial [Gammaproteobacteria bacterium]|nr:TonB-dependent receptor [Gammaproteobacteria bacterium]